MWAVTIVKISWVLEHPELEKINFVLFNRQATCYSGHSTLQFTARVVSLFINLHFIWIIEQRTL